jgi:adenylate cyclase
MKRFRRFFIYRKIQVDILTIFLTLMIASSLFIIVFTYKRNYHSVLEFSRSTIRRASSSLLSGVQDLIRETERVALVAEGNILDPKDISVNNQQLVFYFFNLAKVNSMVNGVYVGDESGNFIAVFNLAALGQTTYFSDPSKPLPSGAVYCLRVVERGEGVPKETWYYKNDRLETVAEEVIASSTYDPRVRPWYTDVHRTRKLSWTDVYKYASSDQSGITASTPILNSKGEIYAVVGVDLSLALLSNFFAEERIGHTGRAFVLNDKGDVIIPVKIPPKEDFFRDVISQAFAHYSVQKHFDFVQQTHGVKYLVYFSRFPVTSEEDWVIAVIVPFQDYFKGIVDTQKQIVYISLIILVLGGILVYFSAKHIADPIVKLSDEIDKIRKLDFSSNLRIRSNIKEIHILDLSIASMRIALRSFGRYVPKEVVKDLIQRNQEIALGGEKREITILFSDISSFTAIAEDLPIESLMSQLAEYFDLISKTILEAGGTIDKYIGDCVMSFWNAPQHVADHAARACLTALRCKHRLAAFNQKRREQGLQPFDTRFGIHTGHVIVGNIGTSERMNYTVIGDSVNIASRLQTIDKEYHTSILISEAVAVGLHDAFVIRPLDEVLVKGKRVKVKIYELLGLKEGEEGIVATPQEIELCSLFTQAYTAFSEGKFTEARSQFEQIAQRFPSDYCTRIYLERLAALS